MLQFYPDLNSSIYLPKFPDDKRKIKLLLLARIIYDYVKDMQAN